VPFYSIVTYDRSSFRITVCKEVHLLPTCVSSHSLPVPSSPFVSASGRYRVMFSSAKRLLLSTRSPVQFPLFYYHDHHHHQLPAGLVPVGVDCTLHRNDSVFSLFTYCADHRCNIPLHHRSIFYVILIAGLFQS